MQGNSGWFCSISLSIRSGCQLDCNSPLSSVIARNYSVIWFCNLLFHLSSTMNLYLRLTNWLKRLRSSNCLKRFALKTSQIYAGWQMCWEVWHGYTCRKVHVTPGFVVSCCSGCFNSIQTTTKAHDRSRLFKPSLSVY